MKIEVILKNRKKYHISAMCKILKISRSLIYYKKKKKNNNIELENKIKQILKESRNNYGSRKIKIELKKKGYNVSIRKIRRIMKANNLVSNYTMKQYKIKKNPVNNEKVENILNRKFNKKSRNNKICSRKK